jgi:hypothetical protein
MNRINAQARFGLSHRFESQKTPTSGINENQSQRQSAHEISHMLTDNTGPIEGLVPRKHTSHLPSNQPEIFQVFGRLDGI